MLNSDYWDLGTLNLSIYNCITDEIATDRVIISREQIAHIVGRHPDAYAEVLTNLQYALQEPDYILRDPQHSYTGLVVRRISNTNHHFYLVLRICTNTLGDKYCNTIISGWKINTRRLERYLRSGEIIYKRCSPC